MPHRLESQGNLIRRLARRLTLLTERDFVASATSLPLPAAQFLFGVLCALFGILLRIAIDTIWNGAGPFGLMVPTILVATLFGRWLSGLTCLVITSFYAWYFVLPVVESFAFANPSDGPRVVVNIGAGFFVVILAEMFRRTMRGVMYDREMLLKELEHRVKNNFASVSSLLRIQLREYAEDVTIATALQTALGRIESYALVNSYLYRDNHYTGIIDLKLYLETLCANLKKASPTGLPIEIVTNLDPISLPRDRAISIGLLVNEIITNAAKHAFASDQEGEVTVTLKDKGGTAELMIADNGKGIGEAANETSLGMKLMTALSQQADATLQMESDRNGTRFRFELHSIA